MQENGMFCWVDLVSGQPVSPNMSYEKALLYSIVEHDVASGRRPDVRRIKNVRQQIQKTNEYIAQNSYWMLEVRKWYPDQL
jgi:hypothetical protein